MATVRRKRRRRKKARKTGRRGYRTKAGLFFGTLIKTFVLLLVLAGLGAAGYVGYTALSSEPIDPKDIYTKIEKSSYMYDKNGKQIDVLYYTENRKVLSSDEIPQQLKSAFIAIEDKTFYEHHGINFVRMLGALLNVASGDAEDIRGTSTITQQLARNVFLADTKSQRSVKRKITEMYYALQIEDALSKDEILTAYLNTIYLGYGTYGVNSAAKTYFSCAPKDLTLAQCAALAALPQAPDTYALLKTEDGDHRKKIKGTDLYSNDTARDRRDLVLALMREQGYITADEEDEAHVKMSQIIKPSVEKRKSKYTYISDYVAETVTKDLAEKYGISEQDAARIVYTGGLNIYTTIDPDIQEVIDREFKNDANFPLVYDTEDKAQAAMVVTEVGTGKVLAMTGGRNASGSKLFNRAVSPRQPGSSIKPLTVYSAALQKSFECKKAGKKFPFKATGYDSQGAKGWGDYITACSLVRDERMTLNGSAWPLNVTRSYSGAQTVRKALQQSINTCAVKILNQVGYEYAMELLKSYGITTAVDDTSLYVNDLNAAALGLGAMTYGTTPLEMSLAYAVFPNGGTYESAVCYTKVEDSDGNVFLEGSPESHRVLDEGVAWIMTDMLKSVVTKGIARPAAIYGTSYDSVGGKTGTTDDKYDIWFNGFTPEYSVALWIGADKNHQLSKGSEAAASLWSTIVKQFPGASEGSYKDMPSDVYQKGGEYFTTGTAPSVVRLDPKDKTKKKKSSSDDDDNDSKSGSSSSGSSKSSGKSSKSYDEPDEDPFDAFDSGSSSSSDNDEEEYDDDDDDYSSSGSSGDDDAARELADAISRAAGEDSEDW